MFKNISMYYFCIFTLYTSTTQLVLLATNLHFQASFTPGFREDFSTTTHR